MTKFLVLFHDTWEMKPEVMDAWQAWFARSAISSSTAATPSPPASR